MMMKILLLLMASLAVIHRGTAAKTGSSDFKFVDAADESEAIREKIRTEMDNYKKIKEMLFKNKLLSSTTLKPIESSSVTESTTTIPNDPTTVAQSDSTTIVTTESMTDSLPEVTSSDLVELTTTESPLSSSESAVVASSTIRKISHNLDLSDADDDDDEVDDVNYDDTTITPDATNSSTMTLEDRFILNAPLICKDGRIPDHSGRCRKIVT